MAHVTGDYPLYYDAINEKGLGMAGLNFVGNASYSDVQSEVDNIAQFEFCRKVSASFSIFSVQWISSGDAVKLLMESMRSHCILPAVM